MEAVSYKAVVLGGSVFELGFVANLISQLPADFPSPIFLALHSIPVTQKDALLDSLIRTAKLPCKYAEDLQPITPGSIHIASPSRHMLLEKDRVRSVFGPRENGHRPALDPLFRSAGFSFGGKAIGVLLCGLTGAADDGLSGLNILKEQGGTTVVPHYNGTPPTVPSIVHPSTIFKRVVVDHKPYPEALPVLLQALVSQPLSAAV